jgi:hypothetical protein
VTCDLSPGDVTALELLTGIPIEYDLNAAGRSHNLSIVVKIHQRGTHNGTK